MTSHILKRIELAFSEVALAIENIDPAQMSISRKASGDIVTLMDAQINQVLQEVLRQPGEGWLSEETPDDSDRIRMNRVWIVDPLDGTKELVSGIPEWTVSVGYIHDSQAIAGAVWNPTRGETFLGGLGIRTTLNGVQVSMSSRTEMQYAHVLASRTEVSAGAWLPFENSFHIDTVGSIAYRLALISAGRADATWTMGPRNEWDIAAGTALVAASDGVILMAGGAVLRFNQLNSLMLPVLATNKALSRKFLTMTPWK